MNEGDKIRTALLQNRKVERLKTAIFGDCYSRLRNGMWQILTEIHLQAVQGTNVTVRELARSLSLPESLTGRQVALLTAEGLIAHLNDSEGERKGQLSLTELGVSKVVKIINESEWELANAMASGDTGVFLLNS